MAEGNQPQNQPQREPEENSNQPPQEPLQPTGGEGNEKVIAALAYILFFIPLLVNGDDPFGKFHANQGLNLLITALVVNAVGAAVPILGWFIILPLGNLVVFIFAILGIVNALNGEEKELPVIGGYRLIK